MPAVRRLTAPRTRTAAITPKLRMAVARNTSTAIIRVEPLANNASKKPESMSDPEIDQPVHDEIADHHPGAGDRQRLLGDGLVPDAGVELRRHDLDHGEDADRQRGQDQGGGARLGGEGADLAAHLEALANDGRQVLQDLAEIAAGG